MSMFAGSEIAHAEPQVVIYYVQSALSYSHVMQRRVDVEPSDNTLG